MNRLSAFTIAELLVVSILSLISATAAITAIKSFNNNFNDYEADTSTSLQISNTYTLINRDFTNSDNIILDGNFLTLNNSKSKIFYAIEKDRIIRSSNLSEYNKDTLLTGQFSFEAYHKNNRIYIGMIDQLDIQLQKDNTAYNFSFSKNYSAQTLMYGTKTR